MKLWILALALTTLVAGCGRTAPATAPASAWCDGSVQARSTDRAAVHGMLIVGEKTVYLSHLPMFHAPHDFQVILEADFGAAQKAYTQDRARTGTKVYTLVPEPFVLTELAKGRQTFKADVVRGHFERGGEAIAEGITVKIRQVLHFRRFDPRAQKPAQSQFLLFGSGQEAFLAHRIAAKPDFDQVLGATAPFLPARPSLQELTLPKVGGLASLKAGTQVEATASKRPFQLPVGPEFYHETGDLAN